MEGIGYESGKTAYKVSGYMGCALIDAGEADYVCLTFSRSANSGNANNSRIVTSTGTNNNNNANNANYYAPDFTFM